MKIATEQMVGDIAAEHPGTIPVFMEMKIDYCCGGRRSLKEACDTAGIPVEKVTGLLEKIEDPLFGSGQKREWQGNRIADLIQHLLDKHHVYTRNQLSLVKALCDKVLRVHGEKHPELAEIADLYEEMRSELIDHMGKEEHVAFPYLKVLEEAVEKRKADEIPFPFEIFKNQPQRVLMADHEMVGDQLAQLRNLTNDFTPPEGACPTFRAFYRGFEELEADLHQHIHLENNVLFPMAQKLAKG